MIRRDIAKKCLTNINLILLRLFFTVDKIYSLIVKFFNLATYIESKRIRKFQKEKNDKEEELKKNKVDISSLAFLQNSYQPTKCKM